MTARPMGWRDTLAPTLSLLVSTSTLVCCALPALLVAVGMGAALAGLASTAPWLVGLTRYKAWLFAGSALLLVVAWIGHRRALRQPCPADPAKARACTRLRRVSGVTVAMSAAIWAVGFFFAFLAADLLL